MRILFFILRRLPKGGIHRELMIAQITIIAADIKQIVAIVAEYFFCH